MNKKHPIVVLIWFLLFGRSPPEGAKTLDMCNPPTNKAMPCMEESTFITTKDLMNPDEAATPDVVMQLPPSLIDVANGHLSFEGS